MQAGLAAAVLPAFVGRERELERIRKLLERARSIPAAAIVRITGASGLGKTALWKEVLRHASEAQWVVLETNCYASQRRTPGAALRRLISRGIATFDASTQRYLSGLEQELTSAATTVGHFELAVTRLIEGVLVDRPVILAFDDAQWLDQQAVAMIQRLIETNPDRPFVIVAANQIGHSVALPEVSESLTITLGRLKRSLSEEIVQGLWPDANAEVRTSLVDRSSGIPFDLIALALQARADQASTADEVSRTARSLLEEAFETLPDDRREFLQLCSLMREPIELGVLRRLIEDERNLEAFIAQFSGRYVVLDGAEMRFSHNLIAEAIRSTITSPLLLRRRIITAYASGDAPRIGDYDRIATLAAEIGDTETEYRALTTLATASYAQDAYESVIAALERALQLRRPDADDYVTYYNQYSMALRLVGRWSDARRVLEAAVLDGIARGFSGVGILASTLLWIIRIETGLPEARSHFREFCRTITAPADRHDLLAAGALVAADGAQEAEFRAIQQEIAELPESPSRYATTLFHLSDATMKSRLGRFPEAWSALAEARSTVDNQRSVHKYSVEVFGSVIQVKERGCVGVRIRTSWPRAREDGSIVNEEPPTAVLLTALETGAVTDFAAGAWDAAMSKIEATNLRSVGPCVGRTALLSIAAAVAAFNGQKPDVADLIEADLRHSTEHALWERSLPLAFWWAAHLHAQQPRAAAALIEPLMPYLGNVTGSLAFHFPVARVLYATRAGAKDLLHRLLAARREEFTPWDQAHDALAAGLAYRELGDDRATPFLARAAETFGTLEAHFFAAYASNALGKPAPAQLALLKRLGIIDSRGGDAQKRAGLRTTKLAQPTLREREVAALVAEGYTNRNIAEHLTLSERTVEVHIANLFNRLNITSRTQLVRYVLEDAADHGAGHGQRSRG